MKFKSVRASLVALLTASLLISIFPATYADDGAGQSPASRPRRGKNGEVTNGPSDKQNSAPADATSPRPGRQDALTSTPTSGLGELRPTQLTNQTAQASDLETDSRSSEEPAT